MRKIKQTPTKNEGCTAKVIKTYEPRVTDKARAYMKYRPYSSIKSSKEDSVE